MSSYSMDPRKVGKIVVGSITGVIAFFIVVMLIAGVPTANEPEVSSYTEFEEALISKSKNIFSKMQRDGVVMTSSPCLSNDLADGWVLDVASSPREPVDDLPQNQCSAYRDGTATHFIEISPKGKIIKVK